MNRLMRGWLRSQEHLTEEELFLVFDASRSCAESERLQAHLDQCWECKTKLEQLEAARADYMFYKNKFQESEGPPPSNWTSFQSRLHRLAEDLDGRDQSSRWRRFGQAFPGMLRIPGSPIVRVSVGFCVLAIAVFIFIARSSISPVSAHEIVRRAVSAEHRELAGLTQPVIYQKLAIKVAGRRFARTIYRDVKTGRHADRVEGLADQTGKSGTAQELKQIEKVFSVANLDWRAPLSPSSFEDWSSSVRVAREEVVRGSDVTQIRAVVSEGPIREASISFRNTDFHPVAESLSLEDKQYIEIAELDYGVVELSQLNPGVFDSPAMAVLPVPKAAPAPVAVASPIDLELDALTRLDRVDALLKDQITVSKTGDGGVEIEGIVATPGRQQELRQALASLSAVRGVRSDIRTIAEAEERQSVTGPLKLDSIDVLPRPTPGQESLRRYLMSQGFAGSRLDAEVQTYTYRIFDHSNQALLNAVLVKQIAGSFTDFEVGEMSPEARRKWMDLIRRHTEIVTQELIDLRSELQPAFSPGQTGDRPVPRRLGLGSAAGQLSEAVSGIDKEIGKSLAISQSGVNDGSLGTEEFWKSFSRAEELAYAILEDVKD